MEDRVDGQDLTPLDEDGSDERLSSDVLKRLAEQPAPTESTPDTDQPSPAQSPPE
jgi:hypothetical protein